jgi:tRNA modification GTPase
MFESSSDTIAAISTKPGEAAIGIVKISGEKSIEIADRIFKSEKNRKISDMKTYNMVYGSIIDNKENVVDAVIVTLMKKPKSYTREDVVEINCHGGLIATEKVLELCMENGARIAEPGEFTKRAFLNGRIDLSQAEAVMEIVKSKTEESLKIAARNIKGETRNEIEKLRKIIMDVMVELEASIDFIEEDLEITPY